MRDFEPSHDIVVRPDGLIRFTLSGFFDDAAISRFLAAREEAYAHLTYDPLASRILVDLRGCIPQSQEMLPRFQALLNQPERRPKRMAFVVNGSLPASQLRRILGARLDVQLFAAIDDALIWLG
jgi:hypothetical protein